MTADFSTWLQEELDERGWSMRQLAHRIGVTAAAISHITTGNRDPSYEMAVRIAQGLECPLQLVLRRAGLLREVATSEEERERLLHWFDRLEEGDRELAIAVVRAMAQARGK